MMPIPRGVDVVHCMEKGQGMKKSMRIKEYGVWYCTNGILQLRMYGVSLQSTEHYQVGSMEYSVHWQPWRYNSYMCTCAWSRAEM